MFNFNEEEWNKFRVSTEEELLNKKLIKVYNLHKIVGSVLLIFNRNSTTLNDIVNAVSKGSEYSNDYINIIFESDKQVIVTLNKIDYKIQLDVFIKACNCILNYFEKILPLGSIVSLQKGLVESKSALFMISKRFLLDEVNKKYITYSLVPYPIGDFESTEEVIYINSNQILKVISTGYNDIYDVSYVWKIKNELILNNEFEKLEFKYVGE